MRQGDPVAVGLAVVGGSDSLASSVSNPSDQLVLKKASYKHDDEHYDDGYESPADRIAPFVSLSSLLYKLIAEGTMAFHDDGALLR